MKVTHAAVFEPRAATRKGLTAGLKKAGLKVSEVDEVESLGRAQLVLVGPGEKQAAKLARRIRKARPKALILAGQTRLAPARWADGVVPLPLSPKDLQARLPELSRLRQLADAPELPVTPRAGEGILDPFTSFYTFAHFKEVLFIEVKRARRYGFPLSVALIALDPLEMPVTDRLREQLLAGLALAIRRSLRDTDFPVQYADNKVLLLMPHTDLQGALVVTRRIRERVEKASLSHGSQTLHPTISVGVSASRPGGRELSFGDLTRQAQQSLQSVADSGGNRVEFFDVAEDAAASDPSEAGLEA